MIKPVRYYSTEQFHKEAKKYGVSFKENTSYFGYYKSNKLLGVVGYDVLKNKVILRSDYVLKEYRYLGIYKTLNEYRMKYLREKGYNLFELTCTENSLPLHLRLGAVVIKEYKRYTKIRYDYR